MRERQNRVHDRLSASLQSFNNEDFQLKWSGSFVSGLTTRNSDCDIVLVPANPDASVDLNAIGSRLEKDGFQMVLKRPESKTPHLILWDMREQLKVDLILRNQIGIENARLIRAYSTIDPFVSEFLMAVKLWAYGRRVSVPMEGTLSTFGWTLWGLDFLQRKGMIPNLQSMYDGERRTLEMPARWSDSAKTVDVSFINDPETLKGLFVGSKVSLGLTFLSFLKEVALFNPAKFSIDPSISGVTLRQTRRIQESQNGPGSHQYHDKLLVVDPFERRNIALPVSHFGYKYIRSVAEHTVEIFKNRSYGFEVLSGISRPNAVQSSAPRNQEE